MANLSLLRPLLWIACACAPACSQSGRTPAAASDGDCHGGTCDPESPPPEVAAAQAAEAAAPVDQAGALAAYEARDYRRCARMFEKLAGQSAGGGAKADALYSAACCHALGGDAGAAFTLLHRAFGAGFRDRATLDSDGDLASLRGDRRWPAALAAVDAQIAAWERSLGAPALRRELKMYGWDE